MRITILLLTLFCVASWAASDAAPAPLAVKSDAPAVASPDVVTIPQMLSYQGKLTDTLGVPAPNGSYPMMFLLYTVASGGSPFWTEIQSVATNNGLFSVLLGSAEPIDSIPHAGAVYLAMTVSGGPELTPRIRIGSAAFAYLSSRAASADLLQGKDTSAIWNAKTLQGKDTTGFVRTGQANSIATAMIVDGTIAAADLGQMGASTGQVMKWTGSAWVPRNDSAGGGSGSGTVRDVVQATGVVCSPNPITDSGTVQFDTTWGDARFMNEAQAAGGGLTGSYPNPMIGADAVSSGNILDGSVTSADIRDTTVNTADIKDAAVTMSKINQSGATTGQVIKWTGSAWAPRNDSTGSGGGGGTVTSVSQATGVVCSPNPITTTGTVGFDVSYGDARYVQEGQQDAVSQSMLQDRAVTEAKLGDSAVVAGKLARGAVSTSIIADAAVTSLKIASNAVTSTRLADGSVLNGKLAEDAVTTEKIADGNVTSLDILNNTIQTVDLSPGCHVPNADSVGGIAASSTAQPNQLYPLDESLRIKFGNSGARNAGRLPLPYLVMAGIEKTISVVTDYLFGISGGTIQNGGTGVEGIYFATDPTGKGVEGKGQAGFGVMGSTTGTGRAGVFGSGGGNSYGLYGTTSGSSYAGVYGQSSYANGILGVTSATGKAGVRGEGGSGSSGVYGQGGVGVEGTSSSGDGIKGTTSATNMAGVRGEGGSNSYGLVGVNSNSTTYAAVYGSNQTTNATGALGHKGIGVYGNSGGTSYSYAGGDFQAGKQSTVGLRAHSYNNSTSDTAIKAYGRGYASGGWYSGGLLGNKGAPCVVSPEMTMIASGTARLSAGAATIACPKVFGDNVDGTAPVRVSLTPRGNPAGFLCLESVGPSGFDVRLKRVPGLDGEVDVTFDWVAIGTLNQPQRSAADVAEWNNSERQREETDPR